MRKQYTVPCAVKEKTSSECTSATWKKSGKGFKVCKKEMLWLCAAVKNNDVFHTVFENPPKSLILQDI